MRENAEAVLGKLLVWGLVSTTLLVTPLWALDPINPIKMLAVTAVGFMGLGALLANRKVLNLGRYKLPLFLIAIFIVWQMFVFVLSGGEKYQQLFGTSGRNTGLITYLAFSILFVVAIAASSVAFLNRFLLASLVASVATLAYGVIQALGGDPFDWVNPYSPVFGFLGNPNFQSSLLGVLGAIVFTQFLSSPAKKQIKGFYLIYLLATLYVIRETDSQQGFLVLLIGSSVSLGVLIIHKRKTLGYWYLGFMLFGFVGVLLGTLNKGPLASLLYKDSVAYRGDYWRAGWKMTVENPVFGVGLDSYGDWYRRSRTIEATLRRGPEVTSNAAHNVFLDISSSGGFPLLVVYCALLTLVVVSSIKVIKRSQSFNAGFVGLVAGWLAFQAQSIISINQIGLAVWGWVLSGLIIGYEINTREVDEAKEKMIEKKSLKVHEASAGTMLSVFVGLIVGILIGMPPYLASARYKAALESGDALKIESAAYLWPVDSSRMIQVSLTLNDNNLEAKGLKVAIDASQRFPNNFAVWAALNEMKSATSQQKDEAQTEMKRLDPLNPDLS